VNLPRKARIILGAAVVVGVVLYLVIFEVGLSAGKVHTGVKVHDVDVGGLTRAEAQEHLEDAGQEMLDEPIVFVAEGMDCRFLRREVGWGPQPFDTAELAMRVGRSDVPFGALVDRLRAWVGGVTVEWADEPDAEKVSAIAEDCEESADSLGVGITIDREALEEAIVEAVLQYPPQQIHQIPVLEG
jgi:hypothetical protein